MLKCLLISLFYNLTPHKTIGQKIQSDEFDIKNCLEKLNSAAKLPIIK